MSEVARQFSDDPEAVDFSTLTDQDLVKCVAAVVSPHSNFDAAHRVIGDLLEVDVNEDEAAEENRSIIAELGMRLLSKAGALQDIEGREK